MPSKLLKRKSGSAGANAKPSTAQRSHQEKEQREEELPSSPPPPPHCVIGALNDDCIRDVLTYLHATEVLYVVSHVCSWLREASRADDFLWELLYLRDCDGDSRELLTSLGRIVSGAIAVKDVLRMGREKFPYERVVIASSSSSPKDQHNHQSEGGGGGGDEQHASSLGYSVDHRTLYQLRSFLNATGTRGAKLLNPHHIYSYRTLPVKPDIDFIFGEGDYGCRKGIWAQSKDTLNAFSYDLHAQKLRMAVAGKGAIALQEDPERRHRTRAMDAAAAVLFGDDDDRPAAPREGQGLEILPDSFVRYQFACEQRCEDEEDLLVSHWQFWFFGGSAFFATFFGVGVGIAAGSVEIFGRGDTHFKRLENLQNRFAAATGRGDTNEKFWDKTKASTQRQHTMSFLKGGTPTEAMKIPFAFTELLESFDPSYWATLALALAAAKTAQCVFNARRRKILHSGRVNVATTVCGVLDAFISSFCCWFVLVDMGPGFFKLVCSLFVQGFESPIRMTGVGSAIFAVITGICIYDSVNFRRKYTTGWVAGAKDAWRDDISKWTAPFTALKVAAAPLVLLLVDHTWVTTPLHNVAFQLSMGILRLLGGASLREKLDAGSVPINQEWCGDEWAVIALCGSCFVLAVGRSVSAWAGAWGPQTRATPLEEYRQVAQVWCQEQLRAATSNVLSGDEKKSTSLSKKRTASQESHTKLLTSLIRQASTRRSCEKCPTTHWNADWLRWTVAQPSTIIVATTFISELLLNFATVSVLVQTESPKYAAALRILVPVVVNIDAVWDVVASIACGALWW